MGLNIDRLRSRAHVPRGKVRDLLSTLVENDEACTFDGDWKMPGTRKRILADMNSILSNSNLEAVGTKDGSVDIDFVGEKWYDEIVYAFELISKFVEGPSYFVFTDAGDVWRYVLADGTVHSQSVAGFLWASDIENDLVEGVGIDIDLDVQTDRDKLKAIL